MGRGECNCTQPVLLQPLPDDEAQALTMERSATFVADDESLALHSMTTEPEQNNNHHQNTAQEQEDMSAQPAQEGESTTNPEDKIYFCEQHDKNIPVAFRAISNIPKNISPSTYSTTSILEKVPPPPVIVWETSTAPPQDVFACVEGAEQLWLT